MSARSDGSRCAAEQESLKAASSRICPNENAVSVPTFGFFDKDIIRISLDDVKARWHTLIGKPRHGLLACRPDPGSLLAESFIPEICYRREKSADRIRNYRVRCCKDPKL
jgi:hypothetical protein